MLRHHEIQIRVRYSETDAMGFLHHSHFAGYFELAYFFTSSKFIDPAGALEHAHKANLLSPYPI